MTYHSSADNAMEPIIYSQLPKRIVQLNNTLIRIRTQGWDEKHVYTLKLELKELDEMVKSLDQPVIEGLVHKIHDILEPYISPPYPSPVEKLELIQAYIGKLQEVIAVNLIGEQEISA